MAWFSYKQKMKLISLWFWEVETRICSIFVTNLIKENEEREFFSVSYLSYEKRLGFYYYYVETFFFGRFLHALSIVFFLHGIFKKKKETNIQNKWFLFIIYYNF